jgi:hypothetical protein
LSDLPKTPLIFHVPDASNAVVSDEGADAGIPVSKVSENWAETIPTKNNNPNKERVIFFIVIFLFD